MRTAPSAAVATLIALCMLAPSVLAEPPEQRRAELSNLLRHDCGACHGLTRAGGLGPPLTPERLRDRSLDALIEVILKGVPDTPMPPWGRFLTREEAAWLARRLKEDVDDTRR